MQNDFILSLRNTVIHAREFVYLLCWRETRDKRKKNSIQFVHCRQPTDDSCNNEKNSIKRLKKKTKKKEQKKKKRNYVRSSG